jgi:excisionase family DNA binding protein
MGHAMKTTKLTEYLKTAEAAEFLGVSQNTLRKWAAQGSMPMQRKAFNGYRLFRRKDLETFLQRIAKTVPPKKPR